MSAVPPGSTRRPDAQNPAAIRYARMMLQRLVAQHLIDSVSGAASHYGGDPTAAWRALSGLTGAPHTYNGMTGPAHPVSPEPQSMYGHPGPAVHAAPLPSMQIAPQPGAGGQVPLNPLELLLRLVAGRQ